METALTELAVNEQYRVRQATTSVSGFTLERNGRRLVHLGSNDYLSLSSDPRLRAAAQEAAEQFGWGAGASPLVCGYTPEHAKLEQTLAQFEGAESAIVFSSGYATNLGTISALVGAGDAVFCDRLNHASIIDGCRLSGARLLVYPHGDVARLRVLLERYRGYRRRLIASDSLFSMDGNLAPVGELAELAERYETMLLLDEAHATGVFGPSGCGVAEHFDVEHRVDVRVGTLSKALGSLGGFVAGPQPLIDWLVNSARPYIFSTALPPACCAAAGAALEIVRREPARRRTLLQRADEFRRTLRQAGLDLGRSESQIVPIMVGSSQQTLELSAALADRGWFVPAIRPPSVPRGTARLRLSLSFAHDEPVLEWLTTDLVDMARRLGVVQ